MRNTVGDVPLEWYAAEEHVGYDLDGSKLVRTGVDGERGTEVAGERGAGWLVRGARSGW